MVRITGGIHRGRKLRVPNEGVRPTKDMVRLALFSALGESIVDKRMVDLFAGSGVIGLEAISRGAAEAVWVESDARTLQVLKQNVQLVCGDASRDHSCIRQDALVWLTSSLPPKQFDLIVADPPYKREGDVTWAESILDALKDSEKLKPEGLLVIEQHVDEPVIDNAHWNVLKDASYGETRLVYYRRAMEKTS